MPDVADAIFGRLLEILQRLAELTIHDVASDAQRTARDAFDGMRDRSSDMLDALSDRFESVLDVVPQIPEETPDAHDGPSSM
ncbi:hypothetical protein [Burkholderia pyrrocinia]|uniref:hypothetical protein n=1 Tax=Burkholderia pyrrocinia TaxID=60550 RepID=UPI000B6CE735|nr:hypothetical protein BZY94_36895 [Burkholderia territorii]HDR9503508.1 hypothetical protein [Burkholderia cepacia]HKT63743.1 hypothetical protein [Burkholderia sp.]